jgi:ribonuclease HI
VFASKILKNLPLCKEETDEERTTFNWNKKYDVQLDSFQDGNPDYRNNTRVYTDGSLIEGHAGSGFAIDRYYEHDEAEGHFALGPNRSVFQAEMFAIYKAAEWLKENYMSGNNITIHVDSQAALLALSSTYINKICVKNAVDKLNQLGHQNYVKLCWIKSHVGHEGNEKADKLAKEGASKRSHFVSDRPRISMKVIKTMVKQKVDEIWNEDWKKSLPCRQTKIWFPNIDKPKSVHIIKLQRREHSLLSQIITGHSYLRRHESLINPEVDSICQFCQEDEQTAYHLIMECPSLWQQRWDIFGVAYLSSKDTMAWEVPKVVQFLREVKLPDEQLCWTTLVAKLGQSKSCIIYKGAVERA